MATWRCGHPRTPDNTATHRDARWSRGIATRCRQCYNRSRSKAKKYPLGKASNLQANSRYQERLHADPVRRTRRLEANRRDAQVSRATRQAALLEQTGHPILAKRIVVLSDIQFPWEDPYALDLALQFIDYWEPDTIILNGDITDCYAMSQFDKNPLNIDATARELQKAERLMGGLVSIPQKIWLGGNHEDRWRKILWREAGSRGGISPVVTVLMHGLGIDRFDVHESWRRALNVSKYGFTYWPYRHYVEVAEQNLLITHGFLVSMHSAYSAKRHYERLGKSCVIGHTHRMGSFLITQLWQPKGAWENGCLCRLDPEYVQFPNWQQGFTAISVSDETFHVTQIPVLPGYRIQYQERVFTAEHPRLWPVDA